MTIIIIVTMGVRYLNSYLNSKCVKGIRDIDLSELSNKKIAIDASIYMYNCKLKGDLIEYMYKMIFTFRSYNIIPVFVFDGKPPPEKKNILDERKQKKREAQKEIMILAENLKNLSENVSEYKLIHQQIFNLKKRTIFLTYQEICSVKQLLKLSGITYYDSEGEADSLCAKLVIKNIVWGCMTDDMDLFIYGCPRVIRNYNLFNNTAVLYNLKEILKELKLSMNNFKEICIVSGTDYNYSDNNDLYTTLRHYDEYIKNKKGKNFYEWLHINTDYINDYCQLCVSYFMFDVTVLNIEKYKNMKIFNGPINKHELFEFLKKYNFIFAT